MSDKLNELLDHQDTEDCPVCRSQSFVDLVVVPAVMSWEQSNQLPRSGLALHGAATLLGTMLEEGHSREELEKAVSGLLDELEAQIAENKALGGPPQGSA